MNAFKTTPFSCMALGAALFTHVQCFSSDRPNILWVILEDTNDWMGCYGDNRVATPHIDALANSGTRFDRAYMTAGICSAARSALVTGMYQTSIGAHHHLSSRPVDDPELWEPNYLNIRTIPELLRQAGYYTFSEGSIKDDYNFIWDAGVLYDHQRRPLGFKGAKNGSDWSGCPEDKPFFGQIQLQGGKLPKSIPAVISPDDVPVPPYYPDHPVVREVIAHHYNTISHSDGELGAIIGQLKAHGLYDNTIIFFFSDHGMVLLRHKQFLYEGGIRVPLVISGPGIPNGAVRNDLVSSIDISATTLAMAGLSIPEHMQGRNIFDVAFDREYVVAARDRCGIAIDRIRSVTTKDFKYIRNFMTDRSLMQPQYRDPHEYTIVMRRMFSEGKLDEHQARMFEDDRPAEEFYDLRNDPHEIHNLVHDPDYAYELARHRMFLSEWMVTTDDKGQYPESLRELRGIVRTVGDQAVNPEYDPVR